MPNDLEQYADLWKHARAFVIYKCSRQCFDPVLSSSSASSSSEAVSRTFAFRTSHFAINTMGWMYQTHPCRPLLPHTQFDEGGYVGKIRQQTVYFL